MTSRKRVVIVDGYSTGRDLVRELLDRNVECLHLRSTPDLPRAVAACFDPTPYSKDLGYLSRPAEAQVALTRLKPDAVIAGSEWGVSFAEETAHLMQLPSNRIETLAARRDKFRMIDTVGQAGLLVARQALISSLEEAHAWATRHGRWPIVIKPLASAGSDGVTICHNHEDIRTAVARALNEENFMGGHNSQLLIQSFLAGPQYIVNTVSSRGNHYVTDIWKMDITQTGREVIPQGISLLDPEAPHARSLRDYTLRALDALGIQNGAAHSELMLTREGPALIETGARIMGAAMDTPSYEAASLSSQAGVLASVLAGEDLPREAAHYRRNRQMSKVLFNFKEAATVTGIEGLKRLATLPSFHAHYRGLKPGSTVHRTADWFAQGGVVYLVHDETARIQHDIRQIRRWEKTGLLYELAPLSEIGRAAA